MWYKKPFIYREKGDIFIWDISFKGGYLPFILSILLIAGLTYLNNKYYPSHKAVPCQQIQSQQSEQTISGFI